MANEALVVRSTYTEIISSAAVASDAWSAVSTSIATALSTGNESDYPLLDFQLNVTAETFTDNDTLDLYRIASDGTTDAASPADGVSSGYVGSFVVEEASTVAYVYGVSNVDDDKFIVQNNSGASVTFSLSVRSRTQGTAA